MRTITFFLFGIFLSFFCQAQIAVNDNAYKIAIGKADSAYEFKFFLNNPSISDSSRFLSAKKLFTEASAINPKINYPRDRIKEIDRILYQVNYFTVDPFFVPAEKNYLAEGDYDAAKKKYKELDSVSPSNWLRNRIALCEEIMEFKNKDSAKKYIQTVLTADSLYDYYTEQQKVDGDEREEFIKAEQLYFSAQQMKRNSTYVKNKIAEMQKNTSGGGLSLEKLFTELVYSGDKHYAEKNYPAAKEDYKKALKIKTYEKSVQLKIAACEKLISTSHK